MNLSGVTWKGAKLRLGEAKPDFREQYVGFMSLYAATKVVHVGAVS